MWRASYNLYALLHINARHFQCFRHIPSAIVNTRQNMTVQINH